MTPDKDIKTASIRKADSNNFYSLAGKNFFREKLLFYYYTLLIHLLH